MITHRPGWNHDDLDVVLQNLVQQHEMTDAQMANQAAGGLTFVPVTQLDISATTIREQIHAGQDIRYLLPDPVYRMIYMQKLYR